MALGRGLGSLIPQKQTTKVSSGSGISKSEKKPEPKATNKIPENAVNFIGISKIVPNPHQPRKHFSTLEMEELAGSIKAHGILQPLVVTPLDKGQYEIIAGERRYRAAKLCNLKEVPVIIRKVDEHEKMELALIENIQRQDLNPIEEAEAYRKLVEEFGMTQDDVGKKVSKSRPTVANALRLLKLPEEMQKALVQSKIPASAGRVLAGIRDEIKQKSLFEKMLQGLTVRESEAKSQLDKPERHTRRSTKDPALVGMEEKLREALKTKVNIKKSGEMRQLMIECYSDKELKEIVDKLL